MSKRTGRSLFTLFLGMSLLIAMPPDRARAGDVSIDATVDRTSIRLGSTFTLTVTVASGVTSSMPEPVLETGDDFEVRGMSTSSSSSVSIINGKITSEKTIQYSYSLAPTKVGALVIPPAVITYDGKEYKTTPINVRVLEGNAPQTEPETSRGTNTEKGSPDIFINTVISRDTTYAEEAAVLEYFLYSRLTISDVTGIDLPKSSGFWWEEDKAFAQGSGKQEVLRGKVYAVYPLKRFVIYPLSAGEKRIEPLELECRVRVRSRDIFDSFSIFGREKSITVLSEEIPLTVLPLPTEGKPDDFSGAVGNFTVRAAIDRDKVSQNEALSLTVTIEGKGNFKTMGQPVVQIPDGVSIYPPDETEEIQFSGDDLRGKKVFEYIVIPREEGGFEIGETGFSYFDPDKASYVELNTPSIPFTVQGKSLAGEGLVGGKSDMMVLGEDLHYIKDLSGGLTRRGGDLIGGRAILAVNAFSGLVFLGFFLKLRREQKILGSRALRRQRIAGKDLRKSLREAGKHLNDGNHAVFTQKCEKAILDFIGNRLDEETTGMTIKELLSLLQGNHVEESTTTLFNEWHESCQHARFSPLEVDIEWRKDLLAKTELLAKALGDALP